MIFTSDKQTLVDFLLVFRKFSFVFFDSVFQDKACKFAIF